MEECLCAKRVVPQLLSAVTESSEKEWEEQLFCCHGAIRIKRHVAENCPTRLEQLSSVGMARPSSSLNPLERLQRDKKRHDAVKPGGRVGRAICEVGAKYSTRMPVRLY